MAPDQRFGRVYIVLCETADYSVRPLVASQGCLEDRVPAVPALKPP